MRKLVLSIAAIALMAPGTALACGHGQTSSVTVSCEQGVRVYRAAPMAAPAVPVVIVQRNNGAYAVVFPRLSARSALRHLLAAEDLKTAETLELESALIAELDLN